MKRLSILAFVSTSVLLFSCGNEPAKEEAKTTDTAATVAAPPAEIKPVFSPFKVVVNQLRVKNFGKAETEYFNRDSLRNAYGITHFVIGRDLKDSNTVFVIDKIEDVDKTKSFYGLPGAKDVMKKAGVANLPGTTYAEMVRLSDVPVQYTTGLAVSHHVKNYDAWLKVFDGEGSATRAANGLIDRGLARNLYDSNTVTIFFEVSDTAKARARTTSPELKKIMTDAGVDSPPTTRWYKLIK